VPGNTLIDLNDKAIWNNAKDIVLAADTSANSSMPNIPTLMKGKIYKIDSKMIWFGNSNKYAYYFGNDNMFEVSSEGKYIKKTYGDLNGGEDVYCFFSGNDILYTFIIK